MSETIRSTDPETSALTVRHAPSTRRTDCHAASVTQAATSGRGAGLHVASDNADAAAMVVRGPGALTSLRNAAGDTVFEVGQTGAVTVGDVVGHTRSVYKTGDETVTASTTPQDDDHLTLTVTAGGIYSVEASLELTADPAGDILLTLAAPSGSSGGWTPVGVTLSTADGTGSIRLTKFAYGATSSMGVTAAGLFILPKGNLIVGDTAGSLTLQWAQAASSATPTTIKAGSWLRLRRMA